MQIKLISGALLAFLTILLVTTIVKERETSSDQQQQASPIKIGIIAPLTGPYADWAQSIVNGLVIAAQDTRRKFEFEIQDEGACEPDKSIGAARYFFSVKSIKLIMGPGCAAGMEAVAPVSGAFGSLLFSTGLLGDEIFQQDAQIINLTTQIGTEAAAMAQYLKKKGLSRIAMIRGADAFSEEFGKRFPERLNELEIELGTHETSGFDVVDFRSNISKMLSVKPEAVFICCLGEQQVGLYVKQLREVDSAIPIYSFYAIESNSLLEAGGLALEGLEYTYPYNVAGGSVLLLGLEERYREEFPNRLPTANTWFAYDGLRILDDSLELCKVDDTQCIRNYFINLGSYEGASGEMLIKQDGRNIRPFGIKRIHNGQFEWLEEAR